MQLVKRFHQANLIKSQQFREEYTSQDTSRPSHTSRLQKQKRFKRNKPYNHSNHSRSSSNCSQSNSISKFYVKNIVGLIPAEIIQNQSSVNNIQPKEHQIREVDKSPRTSIKNAYGLDNKHTNQQLSPTRQKRQQARTDQSIDISNFLRRQFSPPSSKHEIQPRKSIGNSINLIEDSYNFLSPTSKHTHILKNDPKAKDPKHLLQQLTKQHNKNASINIQFQKCKNNQKKLNLLNEQLQLKTKRLMQKINSLQQELSTSRMNIAKLKQQNHKMKVLVKQRDSLMTTLMEKDKISTNNNRKESCQMKSPKEQSDSLVAKLIDYEYQNQKLRNTISKMKIQLCHQKQYLQNNPSPSKQPPPHLPHQPQSTISSSQITWDDRQFTDCLQQKDRQILQLRQQIKNLQIQTNYINRKWANQLQRVKKIEKLEWMKLKDKYKELLNKYRDSMKMSIVLPPNRDEIIKNQKQKKRFQTIMPFSNHHHQNTLLNNHQSPKSKKRNYTVDHLKGRGVMSDIRINYGLTETGNPEDSIVDLELLQYSSCDEEILVGV